MASSLLPKPPKCQPKPGVASLQFHGQTIDRPYDWLKNLDDPAVAKYLRSEQQYANAVLKQLTATLRATLEAELDDRAMGGDAQIPVETRGYFYYECEDEDYNNDSDDDDDDDDDDDTAPGFYRVAKTESTRNLIADFSKLFRADPGASIRHPRGYQKYFDLNLAAHRLGAQYSEQEDMDVSPDGSRVVVSVDFTCGAEDCTVLAVDIATQRQLCTVAPKAPEGTTPTTLAVSKKKKKKHGGNTTSSNNSSDKKKKDKMNSKNNDSKTPGGSGGGGGETSEFSSSLGIVVDSIKRCADMCVWLDNNTFAFVELSDTTHRGYRVWAQTLPSREDEQQKQQELKSSRRNKQKNKKQKCQEEEEERVKSSGGESPTPSSATAATVTTTPPVAVHSSSSSCATSAETSDSDALGIIVATPSSSAAAAAADEAIVPSSVVSSSSFPKAKFGRSLVIKEEDDPGTALRSIFQVLCQHYDDPSSPSSSSLLTSPVGGSGAAAAHQTTVDVNTVLAKFANELQTSAETQSASVAPAAPVVGASTTTSSSSSSSSLLRRILYEEHDPCMEISGLYTTNDAEYLIIVASATTRNTSLFIPLNPQVRRQKRSNDFSVTPFLPPPPPPCPSPLPGAHYRHQCIWLDHDRRPIEFFLSGGGSTMPQSQSSLPSNGSVGCGGGGGTWFITHNTDGDGTAYRVDICSDQVDRTDRSNWHPFFFSPPPSPASAFASSSSASDKKSQNDDDDSNNADDVSPLTTNSVVVEDVDCFQNFIVVTIRRRGFQNLLLLDLTNNESTSSTNNNNHNSSSSFFSLPLKMEHLIDVHSLLTDDEDPVRHSTTWLDLNHECDYDCPYVRFSAHNVIYPDREYMLTRTTATNNNSNDDGSSSQQPWQAQLLLTDKQNNFNPNKYAVEVHQVPVPKDARSCSSAMIHVPLLIVYRKDKFIGGGGGVSGGGSSAASTEAVVTSSDKKKNNKKKPKSAGAGGGGGGGGKNNSSSSRQTGNPMLLYSYASYGDSHDLEYDASRVSLLNRGIVFACAFVRGGGEFGEAWRRAGAAEHRPNTFSDFVACAEYALQKGLCNKICSYGESAGGSIVAAAMNSHPHLFAGVVARVPFVDCLATLLDPLAPLSAQEYEDWGNPVEDKKMFDLIRSYSPVDNIPSAAAAASDDASGGDKNSNKNNNTIFPNLYVESGLHDPRVKYHEPAIWVARLRERWAASAAAGRVLVHRINFEGGHDGAVDVDSDRQSAQELAFICYALGIQK